MKFLEKRKKTPFDKYRQKYANNVYLKMLAVYVWFDIKRRSRTEIQNIRKSCYIVISVLIILVTRVKYDLHYGS